MIDYILSCLGVGEQNATTREQLCLMTQLSDRKIRRYLEEIRLQGIPAINLGLGYYICSDRQEFEVYKRKMKAHIKSIEQELDKMEEWF